MPRMFVRLTTSILEGVRHHVWSIWRIYTLGSCVPDYLCFVLLACPRLWSRRWLLIPMRTAAIRRRRGIYYVRWRRIWWIYTLGSCVPNHLCAVYSACTICSYDLHHNTSLLSQFFSGCAPLLVCSRSFFEENCNTRLVKYSTITQVNHELKKREFRVPRILLLI